MLTENEIQDMVKQKIESEEKTGDQAGGSGHLSFVSYTIDKIETREISEECMEISYNYTIIVESEFTIYPDNPPYEYPHSGKIVVDLRNYFKNKFPK